MSRLGINLLRFRDDLMDTGTLLAREIAMERVWRLRAPVAFLIFNRPETTRRVFDAIRDVQPSRLYVIADGPRPDHPGDDEKCRLARAVVDSVDWPCEVVSRFGATNLGSMGNISTGLDWLFSIEKEAVILEDDCLPDRSFFRFCDELLETYRDDCRVAQISGDNFQFGKRPSPNSYYFSRYNHCWGWATWRRAWLTNDNAMENWPSFRDSGKFSSVLNCPREIRYWKKVLDQVKAGKIDAWDCRWLLSCWRHHSMTILPTINLVTNIGFGPEATNTKALCRFSNIPAGTMLFPLRHPPDFIPDREADEFTAKIMFTEPSLASRTVTFLRNTINGL